MGPLDVRAGPKRTRRPIPEDSGSKALGGPRPKDTSAEALEAEQTPQVAQHVLTPSSNLSVLGTHKTAASSCTESPLEQSLRLSSAPTAHVSYNQPRTSTTTLPEPCPPGPVKEPQHTSIPEQHEKSPPSSYADLEGRDEEEEIHYGEHEGLADAEDHGEEADYGETSPGEANHDETTRKKVDYGATTRKKVDYGANTREYSVNEDWWHTHRLLPAVARREYKQGAIIIGPVAESVYDPGCKGAVPTTYSLWCINKCPMTVVDVIDDDCGDPATVLCLRHTTVGGQGPDKLPETAQSHLFRFMNPCGTERGSTVYRPVHPLEEMPDVHDQACVDGLHLVYVRLNTLVRIVVWMEPTDWARLDQYSKAKTQRKNEVMYAQHPGLRERALRQLAEDQNRPKSNSQACAHTSNNNVRATTQRRTDAGSRRGGDERRRRDDMGHGNAVRSGRTRSPRCHDNRTRSEYRRRSSSSDRRRPDGRNVASEYNSHDHGSQPIPSHRPHGGDSWRSSYGSGSSSQVPKNRCYDSY